MTHTFPRRRYDPVFFDAAGTARGQGGLRHLESNRDESVLGAWFSRTTPQISSLSSLAIASEQRSHNPGCFFPTLAGLHLLSTRHRSLLLRWPIPITLILTRREPPRFHVPFSPSIHKEVSSSGTISNLSHRSTTSLLRRIADVDTLDLAELVNCQPAQFAVAVATGFHAAKG